MDLLKSKRAGDYIAEQIQNEILSGRMKSGQPLRQELLAESLGTSRIPVREAFQILESQGMVQRLATRHIVVADFREAVIREIYGMICEVELRAISQIRNKNIERQWPEAQQLDEMSFHQFISRNLTNEYFVRLLDNARSSYIRFVVYECAEGNEHTEHGKKRRELLAHIVKNFTMEEKFVSEDLKKYYEDLTVCILTERGEL